MEKELYRGKTYTLYASDDSNGFTISSCAITRFDIDRYITFTTKDFMEAVELFKLLEKVEVPTIE